MRIHQLAHTKTAIGLVWKTLDSENLGASTKQQAKDDGFKYGIVLTNDQNHAEVGLADEELNIPSGAAWLAQAQPDVLLIEDLGNEEFWYCAIKDGLPLVTSDKIGPENEIVQCVLEQLAFSPTTDGKQLLCCPQRLIPYFEKYEPSSENFESLISGIKKPKKIDLLYGIKPIYITVGVIATVIALGAFGYFKWDQIKQTEAMQKLQAYSQAEIQKKRQEAEASARQKGMVLESQLIASAIQTPEPSTMVMGLYQFIQSEPVTYKGWSTESILCTVATGKCVWKYNRLKGGTIRDMADLVKEGDVLRGNTAELHRKIPDFEGRTASLSDIPSDLEFTKDFGTVLQQMESLGATFQFSAFENGTPAAGTYDVKMDDNTVLETKPLPFRIGRWSLSSGDIKNLNSYVTSLNFKTVTIDKLEIRNIQSNPEFALEGSYAVH